jgi:hypothetical protein
MANDKDTGRTRPSGNVVLVAAGLVGVLAAVLASPVSSDATQNGSDLRRSKGTLTSGAGTRVIDTPPPRFSPMLGVAPERPTKHRWALNPTVTASSCRCPTAARPTGAAT